MIDINKEEALINYIIGNLTVFKSRGTWSKDTQKRFFEFEVPDFMETGLFWHERDVCDIEVRNTKSLVVNVHIHYCGKDHGHTEVIRCDGLENFEYNPHIMIQDIKRVRKEDTDKKDRSMIDDLSSIGNYINEFIREYRKEKVYWTLKSQIDFLDKLTRNVNLMVRLIPEYDKVDIQYANDKEIKFIISLYMTDPDDGPYVINTWKPDYGKDEPVLLNRYFTGDDE